MSSPKKKITEAEELERGNLLAVVLRMRKSKDTGRYQTDWGDKTALGLFRTVQRIIEEGK